MKKLGILFIALVAFAATSNAQVSATANTAATIITPIAITKNVDLNFGNIASNATGGTVVLATNGTRTPSGLTLPASAPGTVTAAQFTITGNGNSSFSISMPSSVTLTNTTGTGNETMTVDNFTNDSSSATQGTLSAGGSATLNVGAKLTVKPSQVAGVYTNASDLVVTVNYN